jgi:fructose-bisphosphate aldolase class I
MPTITIIGNLVRDSYLALDTAQSTLELDQHGTPWLSAPLDGSSLKYFHDTDVLGGSAITLDLLQRFGITATLVGNTDKHHLTHRYILTAEDHTLNLFLTQPLTTPWHAPEQVPDYLYLDRSANLDDPAAQATLDYLTEHPETKLIIFTSKRFRPAEHPLERQLLARAALIVSDIPLNTIVPTLSISDTQLSFGAHSVSIAADTKARLMTTLSAHTLIASAFIGAYLKDLTSPQCLLIARACLLHSSITHSPSYERLQELIIGQDYLVQTDDTPIIERTAAQLMAPHRGLLAADESANSIHKKFAQYGIPDDAPHRQAYRHLFFSTPSLEQYLSGVILFDETARQYVPDGRNYIQFLADRGIVPGIKVDLGLEPIPESPVENTTKGLDDLDARLAEYARMGARFTKWRAAFDVTDRLPSELAIDKNCRLLADYAALAQQHQLVPIIEPEVIYDGNYNLARCQTVTTAILNKLFIQLQQRSVNLKGLILKVNMCSAGKQFVQPSTPDEVGQATADVLRNAVPADVAGVVFLSGGQTPEQATANLRAVIQHGPFPWPVSFSFARAFQDPAIQAWDNNPANLPAAQAAFTERLIANQKALDPSA